MMNIENKEIRRQLIARYMEAETSPAEERLLAAYYACHEADDDERDIARMIRAEHLNASLLSDEGVEEFDRIISEANIQSHKTVTRRTVWFGSIAAAIALLLMLNLSVLHKTEQPAAFDTIEIAEHIQQMMNLNMEDVTTISASPIQECVLLTATLADGTTKTFVMSKDTEEGSTSLLAID